MRARLPIPIAVLGLLLLAGCRSDPPPPPSAAPSPVPETAFCARPGAASKSFDLVPGAARERDLAGGEAHVYRIALAHDDYLDLVVDQQGIDLRAVLFDPDGRRLLEVDGLSGSVGPERVVWRSQEVGDYLLLACAGDGQPEGRYRIAIREQRRASETDHRSVAAVRAFFAAETLRQNGDREDLPRAVAHYHEALSLWRQLGDQRGELETLYYLGLLHATELGKKRQALEFYQRALDLFAQVENPALEANTQHRIGQAYFDLGELDRAIDPFLRALEIWPRAGDLAGEAWTSNDLGLAYDFLGELPEGIRAFDHALDCWGKLGDVAEEARTLHNRGRSYHSLGERQQALDDLGRALDLRRNLEDRRGEASTLTAIGWVHWQWHELQSAHSAFLRALELRREAGDRRGQAVTLYSLGVVLLELGEAEKALACHDQALAIFHEIDDLHQDALIRRQEAFARVHIGEALSALGQPRQATDYYRQSLEIFKDIDRSAAIATRLRLAKAERQAGTLAAARGSIEEALLDIEELRIKPVSHHLRRSYFATKQSHYDFYVDLLMELHHREPREGHDWQALAASERARARTQLDLLIESGADRPEGTDPALVENRRALERRISATERQRLRLFERETAPEQLTALDRALRILLRDYRDLQARIRGGGSEPTRLAGLELLDAEGIRRVVDDGTLLLEYDLGEPRSYLWAVTPDQVWSYELPGQNEIEKAARRAYELLTLSRQRKRRAQTRLVLGELSQTLLGPVAEHLGEKRLLIVAEGALHYIPFSALPIPGIADLEGDGAAAHVVPAPPLNVRHEVVTISSASMLGKLRRNLAGRRQPPGMVAVVADPVFDADDPRVEPGLISADPVDQGPRARGRQEPAAAESYPHLIYSGEEARAILALTPPESSFAAFGFDATRETVMSGQLAQYRILHFATHGELNTGHPELSRLMLSRVDPTGQPVDGLLFAHEIYNLHLPADLVVLSACQTALGKEIQGEGLLGLTQSFLYAGAAAVIVSLWKVDDQATAKLMAAFYENLLGKGLRPAAALRLARESIRRQRAWQAPYYWAGFVLHGEWK